MLCRILAGLLIGLLGSATLLGADLGRRYITVQPPTDKNSGPPLSAAVAVGNTVYVSGQLGIDPATHQLGADADSEARLAMEAVQRTLQQSGLTTDDLVSVTVYCTDLTLFDRFNAVYRTFFHENYPARAFIGVKDLVRGAHFEIAGIAAMPRPGKPAAKK
jgi:2-iminobutanoate/2-iminopropanoate deaminase